MNASAAVRKSLFVLLFLLSVLAFALIRDSDVISNAKNPVPWLMAGLGVVGYR
ncbi:hypothetical protein [Actinomyces naeslundii]|uniref:hypothetical protein n=1 Tax=Actinomyces naeslundii TaxID=1655 RepID=UPI0015C5751D|nr:hypothetical protein [Actinomyces naeslundii]